MTADIQIESLTVTCLMVTAAMCILAVLVAWYTVRDRIQLSQIILGVFCYVLVMLLENIFDLVSLNLGLPQQGLPHGLYVVLSVVAARELIRFAAMKYGVRGNFDKTDAAIGFAIGFGGLYLCVCGAYYFNCYSVASEFLKTGMDSFVANSGSDAQEALDLLRAISQQGPWEFIATGLNRVFFLVREIALCVLLWYAMAEDGKKMFYALIPLMHFLAVLPDGLFQGDVLTNCYVRDGITCVLSAGIAFLAARQYNAKEDQVSHFKVEHLYAKRRK